MSYYPSREASKGSAGGDRAVSMDAKLDQLLRAIGGQTNKISALDKKVAESFTMLNELSNKVKLIDDRVNELQTICEAPVQNKRISQSVKVPRELSVCSYVANYSYITSVCVCLF